MSDLANPFRTLVEAGAAAQSPQDMASRIEGMCAAIQLLNQYQQQSVLGLSDQIREQADVIKALSERVAGLERLVLRFADATGSKAS